MRINVYDSTVSRIPRALGHIVSGPTHAQSSVCPAFHTTTLHTQSEAWQAGTDSNRLHKELSLAGWGQLYQTLYTHTQSEAWQAGMDSDFI